MHVIYIRKRSCQKEMPNLTINFSYAGKKIDESWTLAKFDHWILCQEKKLSLHVNYDAAMKINNINMIKIIKSHQQTYTLLL